MIASGMPFATTVAESTANSPLPAITGFSLPKNININVITKIVLVRLPTIEPRMSPSIDLLNKSDTNIGVRPIKILGKKHITKLPRFPLYPADSANGVNRNAVGNAGKMNVQ